MSCAGAAQGGLHAPGAWAGLVAQGGAGAWPWGWLEDGASDGAAAPRLDTGGPSWPASPSASSTHGGSSVASAAASGASAGPSSGRWAACPGGAGGQLGCGVMCCPYALALCFTEL